MSTSSFTQNEKCNANLTENEDVLAESGNFTLHISYEDPILVLLITKERGLSAASAQVTMKHRKTYSSLYQIMT